MTKRCTKCGEEKPLSAFSLTGKGGYPRGQCRKCRAEIESARHAADKSRRNVRQREYSLYRKYGLTAEGRAHLFTQQNGTCASCGDVTRLNVDHCHTTGRVRALLCHPCNVSLGLLKESSERILALHTYNEKHKCEPSS